MPVDPLEIAEESVAELVELLWLIDGHLGLAIYRGEGSDRRWKDEASEYRRRILVAIKALQNDGPRGGEDG